jgi:hypothetical protein
MTGWTRPEDIRLRLRKEWDKGRLTVAVLGGEEFFPLRIPLQRPNAQELSRQFPEAREWIANLVDAAKEHIGYGYTLEWHEFRHRQLGRNRIPVAAIIETEEDGLTLIGKRREANRLRQLAATILDRFSDLGPWIMKNPHHVLKAVELWPRLLNVLEWISQHPRPGVYLRSLDITGVDTKFIEQHRGLLGQLLDIVLPPEAVDRRHTRTANFERRYGFRPKPTLIRFRILDPKLHIHCLSDLTVSKDEFAELSLPVKRVFITENEINFLAFPESVESIVIFGSGYGFGHLKPAQWLAEKEMYYWGDIDTHGFAILDQLRGHFPTVRSLLMDRATLLAHRDFWGKEDQPANCNLYRLDPEEKSLYDDLRHDQLAPNLRLEQERIGFTWVKAAILRAG